VVRNSPTAFLPGAAACEVTFCQWRPPSLVFSTAFCVVSAQPLLASTMRIAWRGSSCVAGVAFAEAGTGVAVASVVVVLVEVVPVDDGALLHAATTSATSMLRNRGSSMVRIDFMLRNFIIFLLSIHIHC